MAQAQIFLEGGPWDMSLITYRWDMQTSTDGEKFPTELRVGSADESASVVESDFHVGVYRKVEVMPMDASLMWYGLYRFTGMRPSSLALVDVWTT